MNPSGSRYSKVTRRAFLGGLSAAAIVGVVGCASAASPTTAATSAASPAVSPSASTTASAAGTAASGTTLPSSAQAAVAWTFSSGGGMGRNPYMAVWIEDADGNFVKTLALYHKASGDNWLDSLSAWYESSGGAETTTSGTVAAGSFTTVWDGTTAAGDRAAQGDYYVCIETVVEHGSQSLVREKVAFGTSAKNTTLAAAGQITAASVKYTV